MSTDIDAIHDRCKLLVNSLWDNAGFKAGVIGAYAKHQQIIDGEVENPDNRHFWIGQTDMHIDQLIESTPAISREQRIAKLRMMKISSERVEFLESLIQSCK